MKDMIAIAIFAILFMLAFYPKQLGKIGAEVASGFHGGGCQ